MNPKLLLQRYVSFLFVALLVSSGYIGYHHQKEYPRTLSLQFNRGINDEHLRALEKAKPDIVLIGDSTLHYGVDAAQFSEEININSYALAVPGSATAAWYLVMKNIILESPKRPSHVIILFRDTMLTTPYFRTTGRYFELLDDYAQRNEPVLTELIYKNQMNPVERLLEQYLPLYSARWDVREEIDDLLRHRIPSIIFGCTHECSQQAIASVLGREVDMVAFNQMVNDSGEGLYSPEAMNFDKQVGGSFLPVLIDLAHQNDLILVFIRTRTLNFPTAASEPLELRKYMKSLHSYLAQYPDVYLIDLSQDTRLNDSLFIDSLHLNARGQEEFTSILAEEFASRFVK